MPDNKRLNEFLFVFARRVGTIYTLKQLAANTIVDVDEKSVYVETAGSRNKYDRGEQSKPYRIVKKEWIEDSFQILLDKKASTFRDLEDFGRRHSFLMGFLASLPFIDTKRNKDGWEVVLQSFSTTDLPGEFNDSMQYMSDEAGSNQQNLLKSPFIKTVFNMLEYLEGLPYQQKRETLLEMMYCTVTSSTSGTPITESVAKRKLANTLKWLQECHYIDEVLNPTQSPLAEPFKNIFFNKENAKWAFRLMNRTIENLEIESYTDDRLSISVRKDQNSIHFNFGNWMILGFNGAKDQVKVRISLLKDFEDQYPSSGKDDFQFKQKEREEQIANYIFNIGVLQYADETFWSYYDQTLEYIKHRFSGFKGSPYRNSHVPALSEAVFDLAKVNELLKDGLDVHSQDPEEVEIVETVMFPSDQQAIDHIHQYISSKGFYYKKSDVINLYLSLKTKPFVILSGISGTGKTKIIQWFAESLGATEDNGRFTLIPVRPDWSDGSDLLGYVDIKGEFQEKPLTKVLKAANQDRDKPYFVLLDEMNLARVEYYFSDLLSVMESRRWQDGELVTSSVLPEEDYGEPLRIPPTVYFIGTVNMDETTHPFSKKVLDHANTIEFNDVKLDHFDSLENVAEDIVSVKVSNEQLLSRFLHLHDAYQDHKHSIKRVTNELVTVNEILQKAEAQVGYRVRDEVCFYMIYNQQADLMIFDEALDFQLHQKILPRLAGSDARLEEVLKELYTYFTGTTYNSQDATTNEKIVEGRFPKSGRKLGKMLRRLDTDGFTSFWD